MVLPKRTETNSSIPSEMSFIRAGYEDVLDQQINNILDLRFNLVQSARVDSFFNISSPEDLEFLATVSKSLGTDLQAFANYQKVFLNDSKVGVAPQKKLSLAEALQKTRPQPIDRPTYIAILRNFFISNKIPTCLELSLFKKEPDVLSQTFPILQKIGFDSILKNTTDSNAAINEILRKIQSMSETTEFGFSKLFNEFLIELKRNAQDDRNEVLPEKERLQPLEVFAHFYFDNKNNAEFKYAQEDLDKAKKSFAAEQMSYYQYATNYRLPPINLSRLMKLSTFDEQDMQTINQELKVCLEKMLESLDVKKLIGAIRSEYSGKITLTHGQVYEALISAVDRIAFHGEGDVLKFLNSWLKSQANDEKQTQLNEERIAEKNNSSIISLDARSTLTEQDQDEKIGEEDKGIALFEEAEAMIDLATLVLESYVKIHKDLNEKIKDSQRTRSRSRKTTSADSQNEKQPSKQTTMFRYLEWIEKAKEARSQRIAKDEEKKQKKLAELLTDDTPLDDELEIESKRSKAEVALEVLEESGVYDILKKKTNSDVVILTRLSDQIQLMKDLMSQREYFQVLEEYNDFVKTVNVLNKCMSNKISQNFTENVRKSMSARGV